MIIRNYLVRWLLAPQNFQMIQVWQRWIFQRWWNAKSRCRSGRRRSRRGCAGRGGGAGGSAQIGRGWEECHRLLVPQLLQIEGRSSKGWSWNSLLSSNDPSWRGLTLFDCFEGSWASESNPWSLKNVPYLRPWIQNTLVDQEKAFDTSLGTLKNQGTLGNSHVWGRDRSTSCTSNML